MEGSALFIPTRAYDLFDMPRKKKVTFDTVRDIALTLPDVEAGTSWGAMAVKVGGQMFACTATNKQAEPNTLVIRMDFDQRDELIAADPEIYYLKEHYVNYACVLVRLSRVHPDALRDLLLMGWRHVSARTRRRSPRRSARRASDAV
jgi:hypothetical protein